MYRLSGLLMSLSLGLIGWAAYEMGLLSHGSLSAADKPEPAAFEALQKNLEEKIKHVEAREAELGKKARDLDDREKALAQQVKDFEKRMRDTAAPRTTAAQSTPAKDTRLEQIGGMYEKMEPKKSAKILEQMEPGLASAIVGMMKRDRAAEVLAHLGAEKARLITERLAWRSNPLGQGSVNEVPGASPQK